MTTTLKERAEEQIAPLRVAKQRNDNRDRWARLCATLGAAAWAIVAILARVGVARIGAIELMFLFAPLVVVPLGMELARIIGRAGSLHRTAQRLQPLGATLAVVAICWPPGRTAGALACGWLLVCGLMAANGAIQFIRASSREVNMRDRSTIFSATLVMAQIDLAVGGVWLVASRFGMRPLGIQEPIGLLTAVHFHFAGFATAAIAAATLQFAQRAGGGKWLRWIVPLVVAMPYAVAAGFVISPVMRMVAAIIFSASVAGLAIVLRSQARHAQQSSARVLLQIAPVAVFAGVVLSGVYAIVAHSGSDVLTIPQMARTHGILNAVGFCLTGLLGWIVERSAIKSAEES